MGAVLERIERELREKREQNESKAAVSKYNEATTILLYKQFI
jgi:hypothetical protein